MGRTKVSNAVKSESLAGSVQPEKMVALTLKIDSNTYLRLSTLRATKRKTVQDILSEALKAYLDQAQV
jgi:hypothetical protein